MSSTQKQARVRRSRTQWQRLLAEQAARALGTLMSSALEHLNRLSRVSAWGLVLPLALASCSNVQPYPDDWGALEERGAPGQCPLLSGIYAEWGQAPEGCHAWVEQCRSLSWNLLSGHMSYGEFMDESTTPDSPHGSHVELRQGGDDRLEVLLWDIRGEESRVVREETLSARKDFSCDADGLTLSPRSLVVVFGISNVAASYTRTLSLSDDNHLVLNSSEAIVGHHTFFPILVSNTIWVRWPPLQ